MKKTAIIILMILLTSTVFAQWNVETVYTEDETEVIYFTNFAKHRMDTGEPAVILIALSEGFEFAIVNIGRQIINDTFILQYFEVWNDTIKADIANRENNNLTVLSKQVKSSFIMAAALERDITFLAVDENKRPIKVIFEVGNFIDLYHRHWIYR